MHNNYYFLKQLSKALGDALAGYSLVEAFSQNKNEIIFGFASAQDEFFIKAHLSPSFCCLSFPKDFSRARRNSVDLFRDLNQLKVSHVHQFENERTFSLIFENGFQLLFKMHGNRSNIILFQHNEIVEVFKKSLKKDFEISPEQLERPIDQSFEAFESCNGDYKKLFPTFGPLLKNHLEHLLHEKELTERWKILQGIIHKLEQPQYYITSLEGSWHFSLIDIGAIDKIYQNPIEALDSFFIQYISDHTLTSLKTSAINEINKQLRQSENYVKKTQRKLQEIEEHSNYNILADILMANLHRIPAKSEEVTLENFYDNNQPITIKLKQGLSPQKNAESYYRKSKNQSMEIENLKNNLRQKLQSVDQLELQLMEIEEARDLKTLRNLVKRTQKEKGTKQDPLPFNVFSYNDYAIWVGKNARNNDKLLQQHSFKEDLWLHAKDVSGSHVLIKHKAGKPFPKDVIEKAAELAAYYSKRKSDTLCPVIVTPRKYVRKRKGDPAGAVMVDKEESVLLVRPNNWS